jgi:hypothetical protein
VSITETAWTALAASPGTHGESSRLVDPDSDHDLFLVVQQPGNRRLLALRVDNRTAEQALQKLGRLPRTRGIELQFVAFGDARRELRVALTADDLREVFNPLATDIVDAVRTATDSLAAVLTLVERFEHWRHLLATVSEVGLSPEWRRGLAGELYVLGETVLPVLPADDAVRGWVGPTGAPQDFQLTGGAIEVKTSSGKLPQTMVISNERELDPTGAGLLLLAHVSVDERRGGEGRSLNTIIDEVRARLDTPSARVLFDDLLVRVGYLARQRDLYEEPRYTVRDLRMWQVAGEFPRITETDLRPGVGDCRYRVTTAGLDRYIAPPGVVRRVLEGDR